MGGHCSPPPPFAPHFPLCSPAWQPPGAEHREGQTRGCHRAVVRCPGVMVPCRARDPAQEQPLGWEMEKGGGDREGDPRDGEGDPCTGERCQGLLLVGNVSAEPPAFHS